MCGGVVMHNDILPHDHCEEIYKIIFGVFVKNKFLFLKNGCVKIE